MSSKKTMFLLGGALLTGGTAAALSPQCQEAYDNAMAACDNAYKECIKAEWEKCHNDGHSDEYCRSYMHWYDSHVCYPPKTQCEWDAAMEREQCC